MFVAAASLICRAMADVKIGKDVFKGWELFGAKSLAKAIEDRGLEAIPFLRDDAIREVLAKVMGAEVVPLISAADLWYLGAKSGSLEIVQKAFDLGFGSLFLDEAEKLTSSDAVKDFIKSRLRKRPGRISNRQIRDQLKASAPSLQDTIKRAKERDCPDAPSS